MLGGTARVVPIGSGQPAVIIGEKINPTGNKWLAEALAEGETEVLRDLAVAQVEAGADVLDVNVGIPGGNEVTFGFRAVETG